MGEQEKNKIDDTEKSDNSENKKNDFKPKKTEMKFGKNSTIWIFVAVAVVFIGLQFLSFGDSAIKIGEDRFVSQMYANGDVEKILVINQRRVEIFIKASSIGKEEYSDLESGKRNALSAGDAHYYFTIGSIENFERRFIELQDKTVAANRVPISYDTRADVSKEIWSWVLPLGIIIVIWVLIFRKMGGAGGGGGLFSIGKSKAKLFEQQNQQRTTFEHVAGLEEAKIEVTEIVDFLRNSDKYTKLGGKIPKGALLVGPPGTGKTLLAKAVAGEAGVPFFSLSGSDFVEMFVGVGASRVRDLFAQAKSKAPCIVFIDEIDAIGRARGTSMRMSSNDERENTLNQLLTEMDGFETNAGVILLAATNRADILDPALVRAGRFDRQIHIELPDLYEREQIFEVHLQPIKVSEEMDTQYLAKQTPGFSGADIANVCNEAALIAARKDSKVVTKQDFLDAVDRIVGGLEKKNKLITRTEKKTIAYHEAGHATISWLLEHAHPLIKVTIVPRGMALGAAWYQPHERQITTKEQLLDEMCSALGGRASEEIFFGKVSTGALNDLEKITKQAYAMIAYFGMSEKVGNVSFYDSSGRNEYSFHSPYSDKTAELIDAEVKNLVENQYNRAKQIITDNKDKLSTLAEKLLETEVIFSDDLESILGKRQYNDEYEEERTKYQIKMREQMRVRKEEQKKQKEKEEKEEKDKDKDADPKKEV